MPQTESLAASLFFLYKLGRVYLPRPGAAAAAGVALVYLARTFDEGNMTEEYALPFLAASLWLAAAWCERSKQDPAAPHPWRYAAVYGLSFGAILLLRVTSAVSICCFVLVIALWTLAKKQWAVLLKNAAAPTRAMPAHMSGFSGARPRLATDKRSTPAENPAPYRNAMPSRKIAPLAPPTTR